MKQMSQRQPEKPSSPVDPGAAREKLLLKVRTECLRNPPPHDVLVYVAKTDMMAQRDGWTSAKEMRENAVKALKTLPHELLSRVVLTEY